MPKPDEKLLTVDDIRALREEISLVNSSLAKNLLTHAPCIQKVADRFVRHGLERAWIETLLASLAGTSFEEDEAILIAYVLEELDALLSVVLERKKLEKTVHILVGATGIGKSSLLAKLATRYLYCLEGSHRLAFVNLDQEKVGAYEQLENYAEAMEIPLLGVAECLEDSYDILLVDTAGSVGESVEEVQSFITLISSNSDYKIEVSLVISATAKCKDLERIYHAFRVFAIQNFIVTKLDETIDLSDLVNFLIKEKKPVAYLSTGQKIPEDLRVATKEYLLQQFMQEF